MDNTIENKAAIYGSYDAQTLAISEIVSSLNKLARENGAKLTEQERAEYTIMVLKLTRSVTAKGESAIDSWLDLANYARLTGRRRTKIDCIHDLAKIANKLPVDKKPINKDEKWKIQNVPSDICSR